MTHSTHGSNTPGDDVLYGQGDPATAGRRGPVPPRPVFQRPPGYDTLSPASPYTVVFEPWPDTPVAQPSGAPAGGPVLPLEATVAAPTPGPTGTAAPALGSAMSADAGSDVAEPSLTPGDEPSEAEPSGVEPLPPAAPTTGREDELEPPFVPRPYAASFGQARTGQPGPTPAYVPAALPDDPATRTAAPAAEQVAPATPSYASATPSYTSATPSYASATQPYPPAAPSFVPTPVQPYGGRATPQPYAGSSNTAPDPYFNLLRPTTAPPQFGSARPRTENVGRGLAMALVAVVGGCVLSAFVYHLGFVASIVALAMGAAGIFLYAKGAGAPPRKGALALVVLLIAGILLAWVSSVGTELYLYYVGRTGTADGALVFVFESVLSLDLFKAMLKDFLIFVGFGVLGIFGVARRLLVRRAR